MIEIKPDTIYQYTWDDETIFLCKTPSTPNRRGVYTAIDIALIKGTGKLGKIDLPTFHSKLSNLIECSRDEYPEYYL